MFYSDFTWYLGDFESKLAVESFVSFSFIGLFLSVFANLTGLDNITLYDIKDVMLQINFYSLKSF